MAAAQELDYQPSSAARNLRRSRSDKIGFVFNNSFTEVITGATAAAESKDNNIVLYTHEGNSPSSLLRLYRTASYVPEKGVGQRPNTLFDPAVAAGVASRWYEVKELLMTSLNPEPG